MAPSRTAYNHYQALNQAIEAEGGRDALINHPNPKEALTNLNARFNLVRMASSHAYTGAERGNGLYNTLKATQGSANHDLVYDLPTLRDRSRALVRNNPIATGALNVKLTNVVGSGLKLQSMVDGDALGLTAEQTSMLKDAIEREFALWAGTTLCDLEGVSTFNELQAIAYSCAFTDGDVFCLLPFSPTATPYALRCQLIEADRVANPYGQAERENLAAGVERNTSGQVVAYYIADKHPYGLDFKRVEFNRFPRTSNGQLNCLHLFKQTRPGQNRGIPSLAPIIEELHKLGDYTDAELQAAIVSGLFAVMITSNQPASFGGDDVLTGQSHNEPTELQTGMVAHLRPGEDVKSIAQNRPNTAFDGFVKAVMVQVGMALNLPYEVLMQHFSSSYSASRAAMLQAWKHYKSQRDWLADRFCQPVFELWLTEAVARGRVLAPNYLTADPLQKAAYTRAKWVGPAPGQIDPKQETEAALLRINANLSTYESEVAQLSGFDYYDVLLQRSRELKQLAELGLTQMLLPGQGPATATNKETTP